MSNLEPLSFHNTETKLPISLRGSLAQQYYQMLLAGEDYALKEFLSKLVASNDRDIVRYVDGKNLVIGLRSEKGLFFPDW